MINVDDQLDRMISKQLESVYPLLNDIEAGPQKDFIKSTIEKLKNERGLDPSEFVDRFSKIKGANIDISKLKQMIKNIK